jgi:hypothetical protein
MAAGLDHRTKMYTNAHCSSLSHTNRKGSISIVIRVLSSYRPSSQDEMMCESTCSSLAYTNREGQISIIIYWLMRPLQQRQVHPDHTSGSLFSLRLVDPFDPFCDLAAPFASHTSLRLSKLVESPMRSWRTLTALSEPGFRIFGRAP